MPLLPAPDPGALPLHVVPSDGLAAWRAALPAAQAAWAGALGFEAGLGEAIVLPAPDGAPAAAAVGWGTKAARARDRFHLAAGAAKLPAGRYALAGPLPDDLDPALEALGWLLAQHRFDRYAPRPPRPRPELVAPAGVDAARIDRLAAASALVRDLIDTPARDLGPAALEAAAQGLAGRHGAAFSVVSGPALDAGFPMIAAVGAAAAEAPRLLDLTWGRADAPRVTLVGKGVCFDTGGLDLKPAASMGLMKKDMGGAATALGLADMIMGLGLDLRLRVLIPAVENAVSAAAMRPGDILRSRKGLSVEVNNTDAEGRLVLADALALAEEEAPALIVSLATLTGAARVALGPDVPPFFTDDEALAEALARQSRRQADPLWRLPFWDPYEPLIEPGIADLDNAPGGGMAGAITAALFLRRFVTATPYLHVDIFGWTPAAKPARPKGGACQAARALLAVLEERFCSTT
ncbi:M17 family metallopeptidase [Amaricoccus sp.]|uniref:leucyl aminopeptidase family protein n=1 Tax=Amaricoccus sp. TaxID=1872485 RepID=UPI001B41E1BA|nr:leucyl aminopeptidase family protein [Amaricoccus sp.]MBP7002917.1 leucyl aminopeptidase family protein [Amaricoccus sp.]